MFRCSQSLSNFVSRLLQDKLLPRVLLSRLVSSSYHLGSQSELPSKAQVVICGGGVIGCSVAYHLSKLGWNDVVLLEQGSLSCGTTWHAVGLLGKLRTTSAETQISDYGTELYSTLEEETGVSTGFKTCGALYLARTKERMTTLKRKLAQAKLYGINVNLVTPKEIQDLWPLELKTDDLQGGLWLPEEGTTNPNDVTQSLARGATKKGVKIFEKVELKSVVTDGGVVRGVTTSNGDIKCQVFVNCAGQWARQVGQSSNPKVNVPLHSCEHFYIVTKSIEGVHSMMPNLRDHDGRIYIREWSGGLMAGGFEPLAKPCFYDGIPHKFEFQLLPEDWDHFGVLMEQFLHRIPSMETAEVRQLVNGPESFTPDDHSIIGEAPEVKNYFVAAGMNSSGIASAAGIGKALSEWITAGHPTMDLWPIDIKRFSPHANNKQFLRERVKESLGMHYKLSFPYSELSRGRRIKCSPLHTQLIDSGAVWGERMGWERAKYFGAESPDVGGFGRQPFVEYLHQEVKACVKDVGLVDMTSTGMFEITSNDNSAEKLLQLLCCNDVNIPVGRVLHTAMLNERGCYQMVCKLVRTGYNSYIVQVPTQYITAAKSWVETHISNNISVSLQNARSACVLKVLGPKSEEMMQSLTQSCLDLDEFPLDSYKVVDLGFASGVQVVRGEFVGLQGWQLIIPTEFALGLYDQLITTGKPLGVKNVGYYALEYLHVMNGCPRLGVELSPFINPYEAGLDSMIDANKESDFIGKKAVLELKNQPISKRLVQITLNNHDDNCIAWGGEPILCDGHNVGVTSSAAIDYETNGPVCMGYVNNDVGTLEKGNYQVNIAGQLYSSTISETANQRSAVLNPICF